MKCILGVNGHEQQKGKEGRKRHLKSFLRHGQKAEKLKPTKHFSSLAFSATLLLNKLSRNFHTLTKTKNKAHCFTKAIALL